MRDLLSSSKLCGGQEFDRYRLLKQIGEGGMAEVFLCEMRGIGGFSTVLALKVLHANLLDEPRFGQLFMSEARLGGNLSHPNIIRTLDFGEANERLFLAMEYVEGPSLHHVIACRRKHKQAIPINVTLRIISAICSGLAYAHQATDRQGEPLAMVHRDLKPSNILLSRHGVVKIADFGVARASTNLLKTQGPGSFKGTLSYMSPEQAEGSMDIDHRSDIFAVGLVLYELLTLQRAYRGQNVSQLVRRILKADVGIEQARLPPGPLRGPLFDIISRALERTPDERFQSCDEMRQAVESVLHQCEDQIELGTWVTQLDPQLFLHTPNPASLNAPGDEGSRTMDPVGSPAGHSSASATPPTTWRDSGRLATDVSLSACVEEEADTVVTSPGVGISPENQPELDDHSTHSPRTGPTGNDGQASDPPCAGPTSDDLNFSPPPGTAQTPREEQPTESGWNMPANKSQNSSLHSARGNDSQEGCIRATELSAWDPDGAPGAPDSEESSEENVAPAAIDEPGLNPDALAGKRRSSFVKANAIELMLGGILLALLLSATIVRWRDIRRIVVGHGADLVLVSVTSEPPGASVTLPDGAVVGQTPLKKPLPVGEDLTIALGARHEGYQTAPPRPKVVRPGGEARFHFVLIPLEAYLGDLLIVTDPPGARVFVNGKDRGTTPTEIPRLHSLQDHDVVLTLPGYRRKERVVQVPAGERRELNLVLQPIDVLGK